MSAEAAFIMPGGNYTTAISAIGTASTDVVTVPDAGAPAYMVTCIEVTDDAGEARTASVSLNRGGTDYQIRVGATVASASSLVISTPYILGRGDKIKITGSASGMIAFVTYNSVGSGLPAR